jgi:hypothetical protein
MKAFILIITLLISTHHLLAGGEGASGGGPMIIANANFKSIEAQIIYDGSIMTSTRSYNRNIDYSNPLKSKNDVSLALRIMNRNEDMTTIDFTNSLLNQSQNISASKFKALSFDEPASVDYMLLKNGESIKPYDRKAFFKTSEVEEISLKSGSQIFIVD